MEENDDITSKFTSIQTTVTNALKTLGLSDFDNLFARLFTYHTAIYTLLLTLLMLYYIVKTCCQGLIFICCAFCSSETKDDEKIQEGGDMKTKFYENLSEVSCINEISLYKNQRLQDRQEAKAVDAKYGEILEELMNNRADIMQNILKDDLNVGYANFPGVSTYDYRANIEYRKFFMNLITKNEALDVNVHNWEGDSGFFSEADVESKKGSKLDNNLAGRTGMSNKSFQGSRIGFSKAGSRIGFSKAGSIRSNKILPED